MELHIYTSQIGKYKGQDAYDITVKSGDRAFAPSWDLVQALKKGRIDWDTYRNNYRNLMLASYKNSKDKWNNMLHKGTITLLCYCKVNDDCHRYLLADFLSKLGKQEGINVVYEGERLPQVKDSKANLKKDSSLSNSDQAVLF